MKNNRLEPYKLCIFFQNFMLKLKLRKLPTGLHHLTERLGTQNKAGTEHKKVMPFPDQRSFIFK